MHMVIVGGGSAGWIAANLIAKHLIPQDIKLTLVESEDIPSIGVGEGSTPQLKSFMDDIGLHESDWLMQCNGTYKNGIEFSNWSTKLGFQAYFHPFPAQTDDHTVRGFFHNSFLIRKGINLPAHPDPFFLATKLASEHKIPVPNNNFPFKVNYGYHFDALEFAKVLRKHALSKGVNRIVDTVDTVKVEQNGDICALELRCGQRLEADFFVDCTGASSLLIEKTLKSNFNSFADNLLNDKAVVMSTPASTQFTPSKTTAIAMNNGWRWQIPLTSRVGNGYVYSSKFITPENAENELRTALGLTKPEDYTNISAKHLSMRTGYFEQSWKQNCVAIGMSQGFIEPLEATALHITIESVQDFITVFKQGDRASGLVSDYNQNICKRYEAIRDYIVAHYKLSSRNDSEYWRANTSNQHISNSLASIINCWTAGKNLSDELSRQKIDHYYPAVSWHCLLAGYGVLPDRLQLIDGNNEANKYDMNEITQFISKCAEHYQDQFRYFEGRKIDLSKTDAA